MRVLVWQWGRFGAGPRVAFELAEGLREAGADSVVLSLAEGAEILSDRKRPVRCELTVKTYDSPAGFARRLLMSPFARGLLLANLEAWRPDVAICAMPALLDVVMAGALKQRRVPFAVVVHDADLHPGDGLPMQMRMQRRLMTQADALVTLSDHVERRVVEQLGPVARQVLLRARLTPFRFGPVERRARPPGAPLRLLSFGRLLPYKGLDLLAASLRLLGPRDDIHVRVVGQGPEHPALADLRGIANVSVENRWVPETEVASLLSWSDALVLPYREASQSGVAAAAISSRRWVVATRVGGLVEQFRDEPLALMCDPEPTSIARAIDQLATDPPLIPQARADDWPGPARALLEQLEAAFGPFRPAGLKFGESAGSDRTSRASARPPP